MSSIKVRFVLINSILILFVFVFSYLLVDNYTRYLHSKNRHLLSYEIHSLITSNKPQEEINKKISTYLLEIENPNRLNLLRKYLKDQSYKNTIIKNEFEFRKFLINKVDYFQSKVNYFLIFLILNLLLIPIISILFVNFTVFKELKV
ncbi:MAG: hypothetical protein KDD50_02745, partial [Bdellovibrionales bacterium]|nr:hypothetical protein [Bdellovibrionales bacterium]